MALKPQRFLQKNKTHNRGGKEEDGFPLVYSKKGLSDDGKSFLILYGLRRIEEDSSIGCAEERSASVKVVKANNATSNAKSNT
jgi:hypothetical protein